MADTTVVVLTTIRHGESTDNLRNVWAGWADAVLSNHGMNQARALGASMADTPFTTLYSSSLRRALMTATAILNAQPSPKPALITSPLLREQHFGIAEGKPWGSLDPGMPEEDLYSQGIFPELHGRTEHFPEGESHEDVYRRAKQFIQEMLLPNIKQAAREKIPEVHLAVISHGYFITQLIAALFELETQKSISFTSFGGLRNTAWHRIHIEVSNTDNCNTEDDPPIIRMQVTDVNRHNHLFGVKRQKGGIGSAAFDPKQKDIRSFF